MILNVFVVIWRGDKFIIFGLLFVFDDVELGELLLLFFLLNINLKRKKKL